jgi:hypothetical protein
MHPLYALQEGGLGSPEAPEAPEAPVSPRRNWNVPLDGTRLIMCLIFLREDFLVRDRGLSRTEKDAKAYNWFWLKCAKAFNNPTAFGVSLHGNAADVERFATFGLDAKWSGYTATADNLEAKFKEMRGGYMALQVISVQPKLCANPRCYWYILL